MKDTSKIVSITRFVAQGIGCNPPPPPHALSPPPRLGSINDTPSEPCISTDLNRITE